jgi:hypothetical protein
MGRFCYPTATSGIIQVPRASGARKQSRCIDLYCGQMRVSGCNNSYEPVMSAGATAKMCAGQLAHIVRVMRSFFLFYID